MRVAFLTRYDAGGASSRVRAMQFTTALAAFGVESVILPMLSDAYVSARYSGARRPLEVVRCYLKRMRQIIAARKCDVIWVEKELFPFVPGAIEVALLRARVLVLDFDDALFHNYDMSSSLVVRYLLGQKIDRLMATARLVITGNDYLEARAVAAGALRVARLPSAVDLRAYPVRKRQRALSINSPLRVVWIGSPATVHYLEVVRESLQRLAHRVPLELIVIGAPAPVWSGISVSSIAWSAESEAAQIARGDIGIMPLSDGPWERGKCGYKLIQYMVCGLPVVASPVGANVEIVDDGINGFLASTAEQWERSILRLAGDPVLRSEMGQRGRAKVEAIYSVQAIAPRFAALLKDIAG